MSIVNDILFDLECDLDKAAGNPLERRLVLRRTLQRVHDAGWQQGHRDGIRDYSESRASAQQREESGDGA